MRFILPLLFLIIAGGLFFGMTTGLFAQIDDLRLEKERVSQDLNNALELQTNFNALEAEASQVRVEDVNQLKSLLPSSINTVDLVAQINGIARGSGMTLADVKTKIDQKQNNRSGTKSDIIGLSSVVLNFNVSGSYPALRQFLDNLEKNLRLVDISAITFSAVEREPYQYAIELKTYWLP